MMTDQGNRTSCKELFKKLEILPFESQYIFSVLLFVVRNRKHFITNYVNHNVETRRCENLHLPHTWLTLCQNGVYFNGVSIYNKLTLYLEELVESPKIFKRTLRKCLVSHCCYSLDEFLWCQCLTGFVTSFTLSCVSFCVVLIISVWNVCFYLYLTFKLTRSFVGTFYIE
jgi:hypothetical protein